MKSTKLKLEAEESAIIFKADGTMAIVLPNINKTDEDVIAPPSMVAATKVIVGLGYPEMWDKLNDIFEGETLKLEEKKQS